MDDLQVVRASCPVTRRPFDGFAIRKDDARICVHDFGGYETRNPSTLKMLLAAIRAEPCVEFPWLLVNTGDRDAPRTFEGRRVLSYSTR